MDETRTLLYHVRQSLSDGWKAAWRALEGFTQKIVDAFKDCVDQLAKRFAEEEAVPQDELEVPDAAAPFLALPEDAQSAVSRAFPGPGGPEL